MNGNKKPTRSRGERLKRGEVKIEIIKYILSENDLVSGPGIIKYLRNKLSIIDEKNIRIHLRDLQEQHCIEKIPHEPGLENKWKIEKIENLRNILEHYPDIQLNTYDKSIDIVLEEQIRKGYFFTKVHSREFRVQLSLSVSFFNKFLEKDLKTICDIAYKMYQYGEGFEECKSIQYYIELLYAIYIKNISVSPKIWLDVYKENINNISEMAVYLNSIQNLPNVEISEKTFREIFDTTNLWRVDLSNWELRFVEEYSTKMVDIINQKMLNKTSTEPKKWNCELKELSTSILEKLLADISDKIPSNQNYPLLKELSVKISYEMFQKMFKDIPAEFLDIPEDIRKILAEVLVKIFQVVTPKLQDSPEEVREIPEKFKDPYEHMQEYSEEVREHLREMLEHQEEIRQYEEESGEYQEEILVIDMERILGEILTHQHTRRFSIDQVMFEYYFHKDIEDGTDSDAERDYVIMMRELQARLKKNLILSEEDTIALDSFYDTYIKKYKEKPGSK